VTDFDPTPQTDMPNVANFDKMILLILLMIIMILSMILVNLMLLLGGLLDIVCPLLTTYIMNMCFSITKKNLNAMKTLRRVSIQEMGCSYGRRNEIF